MPGKHTPTPPTLLPSYGASQGPSVICHRRRDSWQCPRHAEAAFWIIIWLTFSPMILFAIKHLTSDSHLAFPYPFLMTGSCNVVVCVVGSMCVKMMGDDKAARQVPWHWATVLGIIQGVEVGLGNTVLKYLSLSLRQEIQMMSPIIMYVVGRTLGLEQYNPMVTFAVVLMTAGGLLSTWGRIHLGHTGMLALAIVSCLCSALRWNLTQKMLRGESTLDKPSALVLCVRQSIATACTCFFLASIFEDASALVMLPHAQQVAQLIIGIGCGLCLMCLADLKTVQLTSALLIAFIAPLHNVSIILLDVFIRGAHVNVTNWFGIVCVSLATIVYIRTRRTENDELSHLPLKPS